VTNAMSMKAMIKRKSVELNVPPQVILQNLMFERFLVRLEQSVHRFEFVVKGGFLISSLVGISARTTMDLDITIRSIPLRADAIKSIIEDIIRIEVADSTLFQYLSAEEIRESDDYLGLRVKLEAIYEGIRVILKLDLTTGDVLTPQAIEYSYRMFSEDRIVRLYAYNLETILAEKLETIFSRSVLNTRLRDFYDIFVLDRVFGTRIDFALLRKAIMNTADKRGSLDAIQEYRNILSAIERDERMLSRWVRYQRQYDFAIGISFLETLEAIRDLMDQPRVDPHEQRETLPT